MFLSNCVGFFVVLSIAVGDAAILSDPKAESLHHEHNSNKPVATGSVVKEPAAAQQELPGAGPNVSVAENITPERDTERFLRADATPTNPTKLPKHIELKAQTGRMLGASLLAQQSKTPDDELNGRGMTPEEDSDSEELGGRVAGSHTNEPTNQPTDFRGTSVVIKKDGDVPQISQLSVVTGGTVGSLAAPNQGGAPNQPPISVSTAKLGGGAITQPKPSTVGQTGYSHLPGLGLNGPIQLTEFTVGTVGSSNPPFILGKAHHHTDAGEDESEEIASKTQHRKSKKVANFTKTSKRNSTKGYDYEVEVSNLSVVDESHET